MMAPGELLNTILTYLNAFTESADLRLDQIETFTSSNASPAGTVSGSAQITAFGFISESSENTSLNAYTASTNIRLTGIDRATASLDQRLDQIESNTGSYDDQTVITSLNSFTASIDTTIKTKIITELLWNCIDLTSLVLLQWQHLISIYFKNLSIDTACCNVAFVVT